MTTTNRTPNVLFAEIRAAIELRVIPLIDELGQWEQLLLPDYAKEETGSAKMLESVDEILRMVNAKLELWKKLDPPAIGSAASDGA